MPKKGRRAKGRSRKWSRANIMNFVAGGIVAISMVLGSIFVFGGATPTASPQAASTAVVTQTSVPSVGSAGTPTVVITQTAPTSTVAATPTK